MIIIIKQADADMQATLSFVQSSLQGQQLISSQTLPNDKAIHQRHFLHIWQRIV
jgi:hypothetical protein